MVLKVSNLVKTTIEKNDIHLFKRKKIYKIIVLHQFCVLSQLFYSIQKEKLNSVYYNPSLSIYNYAKDSPCEVNFESSSNKTVCFINLTLVFFFCKAFIDQLFTSLN